MTLEFSVINQRITSPQTNYYVVADSVNYLKIDFRFTQDWQGFSKLISFRNGQQVITVEVDENNSCLVPWEVIKTPSFMFSLVGMKDGILITTDVMKVVVRASGDKDGVKPKPPTKEFYEGLAGGETNQVLFKNSDADFDYKWTGLENASYDETYTLKEIIETKQDKIRIIKVLDTEGTFIEEVLDLLKNNDVNKLIYGDSIYSLSVKDGNYKKYYTKNPNAIYNEIFVNIETGYYKLSSKIDIRLEAHINNSTAHITEQERQYWNNKVTAYTLGDGEDNTLFITKENI